jgi:hypothetical protein
VLSALKTKMEKMKINICLSILILNLLFGCATFSKKVTFENQIVLKRETISKINGFYDIKSLKSIWKFENLKPDLVENDSINRFPLYITIKTNNEYRNGTNANLENCKVKVEVQDEKTIAFSLLEGENVIDNIEVEYKIRKDGYLYLKNENFKTKWIPGLCGNFELNRTRIGINEENNLILNHSYFIYGAVLFIIGDTKSTEFGSEYKRKR